ncbi:unnamed protein product [Thlaspi arvense]|uniref:S-protein homolog n=1 Tax=Thlaspi arvense TaxID=13288 RepID=A0AAU9SRS9_THLAR|nr:unnamed protein product [Thlaspi arvense]
MMEIINSLGDGSTLNLHCNSTDDDLGLKLLAPNRSWSFYFRPNIWGSTVFSYHFTWPQRQSKQFNIYDDVRDGVYGVRQEGIPCIYCFWDISKDGPCRLNEINNAFDICYDWNNVRKQ